MYNRATHRLTPLYYNVFANVVTKITYIYGLYISKHSYQTALFSFREDERYYNSKVHIFGLPKTAYVQKVNFQTVFSNFFRLADLYIFLMEGTFQVSSYAVLDFRCFQSYYLPKLERVGRVPGVGGP